MANQIEIIENEGELKRRIWEFAVSLSWGKDVIYFEYYKEQSRKTTRHKWRDDKSYVRPEKCMSNIEKPDIPLYIKEILKEKLTTLVNNLEIE